MNCKRDCPLEDYCNVCADCEHRLNDDDSVKPCDKCTLSGTNNPCYIKVKQNAKTS